LQRQADPVATKFEAVSQVVQLLSDVQLRHPAIVLEHFVQPVVAKTKLVSLQPEQVEEEVQEAQFGRVRPQELQELPLR
jgi:hypothetical protein